MANSRQGPADDAAPNYTTIVASWPPEERAARETKLLRKIDLRLLPILVRVPIVLSTSDLYDSGNTYISDFDFFSLTFLQH